MKLHGTYEWIGRSVDHAHVEKDEIAESQARLKPNHSRYFTDISKSVGTKYCLATPASWSCRLASTKSDPIWQIDTIILTPGVNDRFHWKLRFDISFCNEPINGVWLFRYFLIVVRWIDVILFGGSLVLIRIPFQVAFCEMQWL